MHYRQQRDKNRDGTPPSRSLNWLAQRRLGEATLFVLAMLLILTLSSVIGVINPIEAATEPKTIYICNERALEEALRGGGLVTFKCSGVILVTRTQLVLQDTTLDATGQNVTIKGLNIAQIFSIAQGVSFNVVNLTLITPTIDGISGLPSTGYVPSTPPDEWLFMGVGALALIMVSLGMSVLTRPRHFRSPNQ